MIDPHDSDIIYLSTYNSGLLRSTDGGKSWQSISDGLPDMPGIALAIDAKGGAFLHATVPNRGMWELPLTGRRRPATSTP